MGNTNTAASCQQRTKLDFAWCMKALVDEYFPNVEVIKVVLDNLNIHTPAALYETYKSEEVSRISKKLDFHYTSQERQLAQYGGNRNRSAIRPMPGQEYYRPGNFETGDCCLGKKA